MPWAAWLCATDPEIPVLAGESIHSFRIDKVKTGIEQVPEFADTIGTKWKGYSQLGAYGLALGPGLDSFSTHGVVDQPSPPQDQQ